MTRRPTALVATLLAVFVFSSCAGPLFRVKPVAQLPPIPESSKSAEAPGLKVRVAPLLTDEETQDLFETNLLTCGILPIRLELNFDGNNPVDLKKARFQLRDGQNHEWKLLTSKKAVSRILKANEISLYNPHSKTQFAEEFGAYVLDLKTPVAPGENSRRGFLFFQTPDKRPVQTNQLTLSIERLPQTISLALN